MEANRFIEEKIKEIKETVGKERALVALSGGVDSSVVTVLAYRAINDQLIVVFINNGLMRGNEGKWVQEIFGKMGIPVLRIAAQEIFLKELKRKKDPEKKREAIEWCFYGMVIPKLCEMYGIKYWLQGTIKTDIEETQAGIKLQHNVRPDLYPEKYGLPRGITPLKELRKDGVREVARALGLPKEISERPPFLGPGLAGRIEGEVTPKKVALIRKATKIVDEEFAWLIENVPKFRPFQYFPALLEGKSTGIKDGKRNLGYQIAIRCVESADARTATITQLPWFFLENLAKKITEEIPEVTRVLYDLTPKPPATIEYV